MKPPIRTGFTTKSRAASRVGQATVEYVLMLGVAAAIGVAFLTTFTPLVQQGVLTFGAVLEQNLVTSGFAEAATMWEN